METTELVFLKLGGSVITHKDTEARAARNVIERAALEISQALADRPDLRLVVGHGSGSFGHFVARKYGTHEGIHGEASWEGYVRTGAAAARLNRLVTDIFIDQNVPVVSIQPSASALCRGKELVHMEIRPIKEALAHKLVPLVYGDVAFDQLQGCAIISTEQIFVHLAHRLKPERIILAGMVEGVFSSDPLNAPEAHRFKEITPANIDQVRETLSGSHGVDVTGGMLTKVQLMYELVCRQPSLQVRLISGQRPGLIRAVLSERNVEAGTLIHRGHR
jgi:isopentenyl phosphate kinase